MVNIKEITSKTNLKQVYFNYKIVYIKLKKKMIQKKVNLIEIIFYFLYIINFNYKFAVNFFIKII